MPQNLGQIAAATAEYEKIAAVGIALETLLNLQGQSLHAASHVGVARRDPDPTARWNRDHRRCRTCSTGARAAASTLVSTMTRRSLPTTITIRPRARAASIVGAVSAAATTITGTKPACCASGPVGSGRNERRHVTSNERDMPWRLAVEDIARGVCRLSMTIRSFSSSDQRRRRPVSTISSRSTSVLCLWLSIRTVPHHPTYPNKAASAEGRHSTRLIAGSIERTSDDVIPDPLPVTRRGLREDEKRWRIGLPGACEH